MRPQRSCPRPGKRTHQRKGLKVCLVGSEHGEERLGGEVVMSLRRKGIRNVTPIMANPRAFLQGRRWVNMNMGLAYPGKASSSIYEKRRAARVMHVLQNGDFDIIINLHTSPYEGADAAYVGESVTEQTVAIAGLLQFKRVVISRFGDGNMLTHYPNSVIIDVAKDSPFSTVKHWRQELEWLAHEYEREDVETRVELYQHIRSVTTDDVKNFGLPTHFDSFDPVPPIVTCKLGADPTATPYLALTWGEEFIESGAVGELIAVHPVQINAIGSSLWDRLMEQMLALRVDVQPPADELRNIEHSLGIQMPGTKEYLAATVSHTLPPNFNSS